MDTDSDDSVIEASASCSLTSLAEKSWRQYKRVYNDFKCWHQTTSGGSNSSLNEEVFLNYFKHLSKTMASPTMWARYSMLKATVQPYDNVNIGTYKRLIAYLKKHNSGYRAKKSKKFTAGDVTRFCKQAPDDVFLATKVALIMAIYGACRREELTNITVDDVEDHGTMLLVKIPKTRTGIERSFTITGDYYEICKKFLVLRPKHVTINRFFLQFINGKCTRQPIGVNTFGAMPKKIATYLNLPDPDLYTGHSFRSTSLNLLGDASAVIASSKRRKALKYYTPSEGFNDESSDIKMDNPEEKDDEFQPEPTEPNPEIKTQNFVDVDELIPYDSDMASESKIQSDDFSKFAPKIRREDIENDPIFMFFHSMALSVKQLPLEMIVDARIKICEIVGELEIQAMKNREKQEFSNNVKEEGIDVEFGDI